MFGRGVGREDQDARGRIGIGNDECLIIPRRCSKIIVRQIRRNTGRPGGDRLEYRPLHTDLLDSSAGSVSQIRECAADAAQVCQVDRRTSIFIIGHITKDGSIAAQDPGTHRRRLVLHFEGDSNNIYRILRGIKNRFGATFEIGVFEMIAGHAACGAWTTRPRSC